MKVKRGVTLDGLGRYYKETITESTEKPADIVAELKAAKVDVLICPLWIGCDKYRKCVNKSTTSINSALRIKLSCLF